jgi:uncharacterized protein
VELAKVHRSYLGALNGDSRKRAIDEEKKWLAERDRSCGIYKMWVDCLEKSYKTRITELQKGMKDRARQSAAESKP